MKAYSFRIVYGTSSVLAALTAIGLLFGLFGDGVWDLVSWVALSVPLLIIAWKLVSARSAAYPRRGSATKYS
jgi:hypothetical protein